MPGSADHRERSAVEEGVQHQAAAPRGRAIRDRTGRLGRAMLAALLVAAVVIALIMLL
jgi:hypothetical protein